MSQHRASFPKSTQSHEMIQIVMRVFTTFQYWPAMLNSFVLSFCKLLMRTLYALRVPPVILALFIAQST